MDFEKSPYPPQDPQPEPGPGPAGWYPDPQGSGSHRYWDGARWTEAVSSAVPTAVAGNLVSDSRNWAMGAHLSALLGGFVGPLIVYCVKTEDPFVRRHAREALNFNLSVLLYMLVLLVVGGILTLVIIGIVILLLIFPLYIAALVFMVIAAMKANSGEEYLYPATIRFINN